MNGLKFPVLAAFVLLSALKLQAQYTEEEIKTGLIYNFSRSLVWPETEQADSFVIGVMKSDRRMYETLKGNLKTKQTEELPFKIVQVGFTDLDTLKAQILYIPRSYNKRIEDIIRMTEGRQILRVTDRVQRKDRIMINFIDESGKINFELNHLAVSAADITVSEKLLLLGGNEVDAINIYRNMQQRLKREIARVEAQTRKIQKQRESLDEQLKILGFQNQEIRDQRKTLKQQKKQLQAMEAKIEEGKEKLEKQDLLLMEGQEALALSKERTKTVNEEAQKYRKEIERSRETLEKLKAAIDENKQLIARQKISLDKQEVTIKKHRLYLWVSVSAAILLAVLAYFIYRNYRLKNRVNKVLSDKNEEILLQKKQLETQTEVLDAANRRLEESYWQINAGIRYAKTIQSAVLPQLSSISDYFESFVFYRPKDYVSGDFFWAKPLTVNRTEYFFAAVVDCTGHGVPGAFMSFVGNRILDEIVIAEKEIDTVKILEKMHQKVSRIFETKTGSNRDGMVLSLLRTEKIKKDRRRVLFSGAKQAIFIKDPGDEAIIRLRGDVKEIGSPHYDMVDFTVQEMVLSEGTQIYMLTDGLVDQNNPQRKKFGTYRVRNLLKRASQLPVKKQHDYIAEELDNFAENAEQRDDITLMGLKL